jgi:hypothetical protein
MLMVLEKVNVNGIGKSKCCGFVKSKCCGFVKSKCCGFVNLFNFTFLVQNIPTSVECNLCRMQFCLFAFGV